MAKQHSLVFENVDSNALVNQITTALLMLDGVSNAEVGRHGAEVEGNVQRADLIKAVRRVSPSIKVS